MTLLECGHEKKEGGQELSYHPKCMCCGGIAGQYQTWVAGLVNLNPVCFSCWNGYVPPMPPKPVNLTKQVEPATRVGVCGFCGCEGAFQFKGDNSLLVCVNCVKG